MYGYKQCRSVIMTPMEVGSQCSSGLPTQEHHPRFAAFPVSDNNRPTIQVSVLQRSVEQFLRSCAGIQQEEENRTVTVSGERSALAGAEECPHVFKGSRLQRGPVPLWVALPYA